ncbi:class I SAM-dependent methyltransferase [Gammaproteobacteria bacterium]|nr:class I SAM-dependent methyltransferase [Gammaproteobacteria bacterium]
MSAEQTHFGFDTVDAADKSRRVGGVFSSVADNYDLMNDLMSGGVHRLWKAYAIARAAVRPGYRVLDLATGSADLALPFARRVGPDGLVVASDINAEMLQQGRDRAINQGLMTDDPLQFCLVDAEKIPFPDGWFDLVTISFGLRNVTHIDRALSSIRRVLRPGGRLMVLEFSKPLSPTMRRIYDAYSFNVIPKIGQYIAGDEPAYQYLVESIRQHPDQETLAGMMRIAGFDAVGVENLTGGVVALHVATVY